MTEHDTLETIRNFLSSEKLAGIEPLDILIVVHLVTRRAEDHDVWDSQQTLARMFNVDPRTIARSLDRLTAIDWVASTARPGKTNLLSLKYQNIPAEEILRLQITQEAKELAFRYQQALRKNFGRKKFPKQWLQQQFASAQRIINACQGDVELGAALIGHALSHPLHTKKARQSLYHCFGRWRQINKTYSAQLEAMEQQRQQAERTQEDAA